MCCSRLHLWCFFSTITDLAWHAMPHAKCLVSCFLVTFLFPISGMWSGAQLPDNDTDCGDINAWSKAWLLLDISAGVTQAGLLPSEQNEGWLPPPPPPRRQANHPHNNRVRGQWRENKPVSFTLCVFFLVCTAFLRLHSRSQCFQLISFYKARPLHNYPLSIRSHPVQHCRLKPC